MKTAPIIIAAVLSACSSAQTATETAAGTPAAAPVRKLSSAPARAAAHTIIYRTTADYDTLVPVGMDAARSRIVSYPAPTDINDSQRPLKLDGGYLLDRRGLTPGSAFVDIGYDAYSRLQGISAAELMGHIVGGQPFVEMWDCGVHTRLSVDEANRIVASGFEGCRRIL